MNEPRSPVVSRRPHFPLVWIVPLVAVAISGWLLVRQWQTRGPEITIEFAHGGSIEAGRTVLQHKGVTVGRVIGVELADDLQRVAVRLRLERSAASLARAGSLFRVVQPQISLAGIRGLETLFSGVHLAVDPGDGEPQHHFRGLDGAPPTRDSNRGRAFVLEARQLGGLTPGTAVSYRGIQVGFVEEVRLSDDARQVLIRVRVGDHYAPLVRPNTRFWSSGGLSMKVGLLGAQLNSNSLASLLSPGISFATPDEDARQEPAGTGARYVLHDEPDEDWTEWNPAIPLKLPDPARALPTGHIGG